MNTERQQRVEAHRRQEQAYRQALTAAMDRLTQAGGSGIITVDADDVHLVVEELRNLLQ